MVSLTKVVVIDTEGRTRCHRLAEPLDNVHGTHSQQSGRDKLGPQVAGAGGCILDPCTLLTSRKDRQKSSRRQGT